MTTRKRLLYVITPIILVIAYCSISPYWPMLTRDPIPAPVFELPTTLEGIERDQPDRFAGHPEAAILEKYGPPSFRFEGVHGNPSYEYRLRYRDAVTIAYELPGGILYLTICWQKGQRICLRSDSMPEGMRY